MTTKTIDRGDPFWRMLFFEAWKQRLVPGADKGDAVLIGASIAKEAASLADDAMTHALGIGQAEVCPECLGVGCEVCNFSARVGGKLPAVPAVKPKCGSCWGTGHKGTMGESGSVSFDPVEKCESCGGSGEYSGGLVQHRSNERPPELVASAK